MAAITKAMQVAATPAAPAMEKAMNVEALQSKAMKAKQKWDAILFINGIRLRHISKGFYKWLFLAATAEATKVIGPPVVPAMKKKMHVETMKGKAMKAMKK